LAGGQIGKLQNGDIIEIVIDRTNLTGTVNLIGTSTQVFGAEQGSRELQQRSPRPDLRPHPDLPDDTRLWAALVQASGGIWGGCVYDADSITSLLDKGRQFEDSH
jgi:dihydroxyacid dehydratase/phosphogluconate dehydratase